MKKSIIAAGAASVALAAMPVVGAFAAFTGSFTDVIQTTIGESCTFTRGATAHGAGETWTTDTTVTTKDTLSAVTITPAAAEVPIGTSNFRVVCNDTDGYKVTVGTNSLTLPSSVTTQVHDWNYIAGAAPSSPTASYWRIGSSGDNVDLANNIVSTKSSAEDGKDFTITYYAYAITGQDAGTYSAEVTYTAAQLP